MNRKEIVGWWSNDKSKPPANCPKCGAPGIIVPKRGHPNSRFWDLQRHDNEQLECCKNGCLMRAEEK